MTIILSFGDSELNPDTVPFGPYDLLPCALEKLGPLGIIYFHVSAYVAWPQCQGPGESGVDSAYFHSRFTPREPSAFWNSYCWDSSLRIVLELGGGVLEQLDWRLNLITDRIVTFQQNTEDAINITCKNDVSAVIWEGER